MSDNGVVMPEEYRDVIYRLTYHYLGKIAPYIPNRLSPNVITFSAFCFACLGCLLLYVVPSPVAFLYWALCNFIWYILDALDGIHARLSHQTSEFGAFLDHFLDNVFFIVMFFVFTLRFDLAYPLYILIMLMRFTAATTVFIVQHHTGRLHLGRFSGGGELLLMTLVMLLSYAYPYFNPALQVTNTTLLYWITHLHLQQGFFMKLILLVYLIAIPVNLLLMYRATRIQLI